MKPRFALRALVAATALAVSTTALAGAMRLTSVGSDFETTDVFRNDDGFVGPVALGFTANFFGLSFTSAFVNNNGNITFDSGLSTFTPFGLTSTARQIIAPFFGDVDTRSAGQPVRYGTSTVDGHAAFGVTYRDVDYFPASTSHTNRNSFQVVLIDRSDTGAGNFDIEFNYDQIQWEAGTASGSNNDGRGGSCARAGFSNGTGTPGTNFELPGSGVCGAFLDGTGAPVPVVGANSLPDHSLNSTVDGRYLFSARNGTIIVRPGVPEPASLALLGLGLAGLGAIRRRRA